MKKLIETKEQTNIYRAVEALRNAGVSYESIEKFNIGYEDNKLEKQYDKIIFPVYDEIGNNCGIVAKRIDKNGKGALYTVLLSDVTCVYGLNFAINSSEDSFILCEGVLDTILLHQNGFDNAVGYLLTYDLYDLEEVAFQLKKHKTKVCIIFDSDEYGRKGAKQAANIFEHAGMKTSIIDLGDYRDPRLMMQSDSGIEKLKELINKTDHV